MTNFRRKSWRFTVFLVTLGVALFYFCPNVSAVFLPNDSNFKEQWYLNQVKAPEAWDVALGSEDVVVAVLDTGVDVNHPDLKNNIWKNPKEIADGVDNDSNGYIDDIYGWNFVENTRDISPQFTANYSKEGIHHGTMIAGIIAAVFNNNQGIAGVAPKVKIMSLRCLNSEGVGNSRAIVAGIDYAIKNGARILNLSFIGADSSPALEKAIEKAYQAGLTIVAAAGNDDGQGQGVDLDKTKIYPACYDGPEGENWILGVAATDTLDQKAPFSSYGKNCVDVAAPGMRFFGTRVYSSIHPDYSKYYAGYTSGTSMAAPLVSGTAALLKSIYPEIANKDIYEIIKNNADDIEAVNPEYAGKLGSGRLNVFRAVSQKFTAGKIVEEITLPAPAPKERFLAVFQSDAALFNFFDLKGALLSRFELPPAFYRGQDFDFIFGDLDADGADEIIAGAPFGKRPLVSIFSREGQLKKEFLVYDAKFLGGVQVALADLNADGRKEIITAPFSGGGPHIRIFSGEGEALSAGFFAYDKKSRQEIAIAAGDVNFDGYDEIIVAAKKGEARVFKGTGELISKFSVGAMIGDNFEIGVGDLNGDGWKEIVLAVQGKGGYFIKTFNVFGRLLSPPFLAYGKKTGRGLSLTVADTDGDGRDEIIIGSPTGASAEYRIFDAKGDIKMQFYPFGKEYKKGIKVGAIAY